MVAPKLRVLALHGGASNSAILRFQTARLRNSLGKNAEWLFPDALEPWEPRLPSLEGRGTSSEYELYYSERSEIEKRIARGKPFVSWYCATESPGGALEADPESSMKACHHLREYIAQVGPVDVLVAFTQGVQVAIMLANGCRDAGEEVPWRLNLYFCGLQPSTWYHVSEPFLEPTYLVVHSQDELLYSVPAWYLTHFVDLHVLEHGERWAFPSAEPRASHIYAELTAAVRGALQAEVYGEVAASVSTGPSKEDPRVEALLASRARVAEAGDSWYDILGVAPTALADEARKAFRELALLHHPDKLRGAVAEDDTFKRVQRAYEQALAQCPRHRAVQAVALAERDRLEQLKASALQRVEEWLNSGERKEVEQVPPEELAQMLLQHSCVVLDSREPEQAGLWAFPGALQDLAYTKLRTLPHACDARLAKVRDDGRCVVALSMCGEQCERYCELLVGAFGFKEERLCRLEGGFHRWRTWLLEHAEVAAALTEEIQAGWSEADSGCGHQQSVGDDQLKLPLGYQHVDFGVVLDKASALQMQNELLHAYTAADFQARLHEGWRARGKQLERLQFRQQLCLGVQGPIISKYGFPVSRKGVAQSARHGIWSLGDVELGRRNELMSWFVDPDFQQAQPQGPGGSLDPDDPWTLTHSNEHQLSIARDSALRSSQRA